MPIAVGTGGPAGLQRADIAVSGLEHGGPSYELRIFLDNPDADARTELTEDNGYAGSIYVYGQGQPPEHGAQPRLPKPRSIMATDPVRAAASRRPEVSVTLVPVVSDGSEADIDLDSVDVAVLVDDPPPDIM